MLLPVNSRQVVQKGKKKRKWASEREKPIQMNKFNKDKNET